MPAGPLFRIDLSHTKCALSAFRSGLLPLLQLGLGLALCAQNASAQNVSADPAPGGVLVASFLCAKPDGTVVHQDLACTDALATPVSLTGFSFGTGLPTQTTIDAAGVTSGGVIEGATVQDGAGASLTGGTVTGTVLTDGQTQMTGGDITNVSNVTGDNTGAVSGFQTVQGVTVTDGQTQMSGGDIANVSNVTGDGTGAVSNFQTIEGVVITDGIAQLTGSNITQLTNVTGNGTGRVTGFIEVEADQLTDGQTIITGGDITNVTNITGDGTGTLTGFQTVEGTTLTDGQTQITGGDITNVTNITGDGTGTLTGFQTVTTSTVNTTNLSVSGGTVDMGGSRIQNVQAPTDPNDAATKAYVDALASGFVDFGDDVINRFERNEDAIDRNEQGIAIAIALSGLALPTGKAFAMSGDMGFYEGKSAVAMQGALRLNENVVLSGGVGVGMERQTVGGRIGAMAAW